jgi:hypothetical protein
MLGTALFLARRSKGVQENEKPPKERKSSALGAVLLGIAMWTPSLFYLSGLKLVADASPSVTATVISALVLSFCVLLLIEVPIVLFLLFPDATNRKVAVFDAWLRHHIRRLLIWGLTIAGLFMLAYGTVRFAGR